MLGAAEGRGWGACAASSTPVLWANIQLLWGGFLEGRDLVTIGVLVAFVQYVRRFFMPMRSISVLWANIQSGIAGMERIFELLDDDRIAAEPAAPAALSAGPGRVELRGVSFAYVPGTPVLRGVDLTVEAGTMAALVGPTGAGKTTILALVQRLYDPAAGRILLDGQDVAEFVAARCGRRWAW